MDAAAAPSRADSVADALNIFDMMSGSIYGAFYYGYGSEV